MSWVILGKMESSKEENYEKSSEQGGWPDTGSGDGSGHDGLFLAEGGGRSTAWKYGI